MWVRSPGILVTWRPPFLGEGGSCSQSHPPKGVLQPPKAPISVSLSPIKRAPTFFHQQLKQTLGDKLHLVFKAPDSVKHRTTSTKECSYCDSVRRRCGLGVLPRTHHRKRQQTKVAAGNNFSPQFQIATRSRWPATR